MSFKSTYVPHDAGTTYRVSGGAMTVKATATETGGAFEVVHVRSGRGGDVLAHRHPWAEAYYVLAGRIDLRIGARRLELGAGDYASIPARAVHGFTVLSEELEFLHISVGHGATDAFADLDRLPEDLTEDDLPLLFAIGEAHGLELVLDGL